MTQESLHTHITKEAMQKKKKNQSAKHITPEKNVSENWSPAGLNVHFILGFRVLPWLLAGVQNRQHSAVTMTSDLY